MLGSPPSRNELSIKILIAVTANYRDVAQIVQTQRTATMGMLQKYTRLKKNLDSESSLAWVLAIDALILRAEADIAFSCLRAAVRYGCVFGISRCAS